MPWVNGAWQPESDSVATRVTDITSKDSPLMRQAAASGLKAANARGLANSSMGIGAATGATLAAATPIASQDAQQTYGKNVQFMQGETSKTIQQMQDESKAKEVAASASTQLASTYTQGIGNTLVNDKIPAATRSTAQADMAALYRNTIDKIKGIYPNVQLAWG